MILFVTTPFGDNRAMISPKQPEHDNYFTVDAIPEGDGILVVEQGALVRVPMPPPREPTEQEKQIAELQATVAELTTIVEQLTATP